MVIPTSDSVSTMSTTGSSQFVDARSRITGPESKYTDADSKFSDANSKADSKIIADNIRIEKKEEKKTFEDEKNEKKVFSSGNTLETKEEIKTEQPQKVKEPKAFVSREEKIRRIKEQEAKSGYQRETGECHDYIFNCNLLDLLDLPNWKSLFCCCCTLCCNSCVSSGTTTVKNVS